MPIAKVDTEQRLAFGWASIALDDSGNPVIDHQGDIIPVAELEKAAYTYVAKSRDASEMHERRGVATLVESIVVTDEKRDAMGIGGGPTGWWVGYHVDDDKVWSAVKTGELSEFSIGGTAKPEAIGNA